MTQVSPFNLRMMISARACVISVAMQSIFKCFGAFHFCVNSPKHTAVHMDDGSDNGLHDDTPHPRTGSSQRDVLDRQQTSASHEEVDHDSPALASARAFREPVNAYLALRRNFGSTPFIDLVLWLVGVLIPLR